MGEITTFHAQRLRTLRKKRTGTTQKDIAEFLDISQQAYSKLENGETSFSDDTIEKIARFFEITPDEFERPEAMYVGNNSMNVETTITIDVKFLDVMQKMYDQNVQLIDRTQRITDELLKEKDLRISQLEKSSK